MQICLESLLLYNGTLNDSMSRTLQSVAETKRGSRNRREDGLDTDTALAWPGHGNTADYRYYCCFWLTKAVTMGPDYHTLQH